MSDETRPDPTTALLTAIADGRVVVLRPGDVLFRREVNGWHVVALADAADPGDVPLTSVYEDSAGGPFAHPCAESFLNGLWDHFDWLFRSKRQGGLVARYYATGHETDMTTEDADA